MLPITIFMELHVVDGNIRTASPTV